MEKSKIIYLIGYPGVGKLTIAKEISKVTDFVIIDNHSVNNLFFKVFNNGSGNFPGFLWNAIDEAWDLLFKTYKKNRNPMNLIFTNALFQEKEFSKKLFARIEKFAQEINAELYPVVITCDWDIHKNRINSKDRALNFKITSEDMAQEIVKDNKLFVSTHKNTILIDNSNMTPQQVAKLILDKLS